MHGLPQKPHRPQSRQARHQRGDHGRAHRTVVAHHLGEGDARNDHRAHTLKDGLEQNFGPRGLVQMCGQNRQTHQHKKQGHKTHKGKCRDGHGGPHRIEAVAAHHHAVTGPAQACGHEQQIALPDFAAVKSHEQAGSAHQHIAQHNKAQAHRPHSRHFFTQEQPSQQGGPQGQAARHEHRGMRGRRVKKPGVSQDGVQKSPQHPRLHRGAQRQGRQAPQRPHLLPGLPRRSHEPPSPRQQNSAGPQNTRKRDVQRQQAPGRRGTRNDNETGPDEHRDDRRSQAHSF